ncbi:MAG: hypothetical protein WCQ82_05470 [Bacteroidaceae bacterium]
MNRTKLLSGIAAIMLFSTDVASQNGAIQERENNCYPAKTVLQDTLSGNIDSLSLQAPDSLYIEEKKAEKQKEEKEVPQTVTISFNDIKVGTILGGMRVSKLESQENDFFKIQFTGEFNVEGDLVYNEFEDTYFLQMDEVYHQKYTIQFPHYEREERFEFYSSICFNFDSLNEMKRAYGAANLKRAQNGMAVRLKIRATNLSLSVKLDKGMLGVGCADFVKRID